MIGKKEWQSKVESSAEPRLFVFWSGFDVPFHLDDCPHYDGKRCRLTGFKPEGLCEPAVQAMAVVMDKGEFEQGKETEAWRIAH